MEKTNLRAKLAAVLAAYCEGDVSTKKMKMEAPGTGREI